MLQILFNSLTIYSKFYQINLSKRLGNKKHWLSPIIFSNILLVWDNFVLIYNSLPITFSSIVPWDVPMGSKETKLGEVEFQKCSRKMFFLSESIWGLESPISVQRIHSSKQNIQFNRAYYAQRKTHSQEYAEPGILEMKLSSVYFLKKHHVWHVSCAMHCTSIEWRVWTQETCLKITDSQF